MNDHEVVEPLKNPRCNRGQRMLTIAKSTLKGLNQKDRKVWN